MQLQIQAQIGSLVFSGNFTSVDDGRSEWGPHTYAAAKAGVLTTRTGDTEGAITLSAGHGFEDGNIVDVFWGTNSVAYGFTVDMTGDVMAITGGAGDALPAAETDVIVALSNVITPVTIPYAKLLGIMAMSSERGLLLLEKTGPAVEEVARLYAELPWFWFSETGQTNPLTADIISARFSNASLTESATFQMAIEYDAMG